MIILFIDKVKLNLLPIILLVQEIDIRDEKVKDTSFLDNEFVAADFKRNQIIYRENKCHNV